MTVSILIITHNDIGSNMLKAATATFGELPLPATAVTINYDTDPSLLLPRLYNLIENIDQGEGILVLTDLFGSTPSNIAQELQSHGRQVRVIAGLNLSMLISVMNYPQRDLAALAEKALSAGHEGIINCTSSADKKC